MAKSLHLQRQKLLPEVTFDLDAATLCIRGFSLPENSAHFYTPLIDWIKGNSAVISSDNRVYSFYLDMEYCNSSSFIFIVHVLRILLDCAGPERTRIFWYYDDDNDESMECCHDLEIALSVAITAVARDITVAR